MILKIVSVLCVVFVVSTSAGNLTDLINKQCNSYVKTSANALQSLKDASDGFQELNEMVERIKAHDKLTESFKQAVKTLGDSIVKKDLSKYNDCVSANNALFTSLKANSEHILKNKIPMKNSEDPIAKLKKTADEEFSKLTLSVTACDAIPTDDVAASLETFKEHSRLKVQTIIMKANTLLKMTVEHKDVEPSELLDVSVIKTINDNFDSLISSNIGIIDKCMK